ncbi:hypothetical protein K3495_g7217 [Podosphaera aphanis]|nr:hypothetical protein K3495_g7217 [Podosphaera aphanis]
MTLNTSPSSFAPRVSHISTYERLGLFIIYGIVVLETAVSLLTGIIYSKKITRHNYRRHVFLTTIRAFLKRANTNQMHHVYPPTDKAYSIVCRKRGVTPKSEILDDGTVAHWIGDSQAKKVLLYFHGGGFVLAASPPSVEFMFQIVDFAKANGKNIACLLLAYDLAPEAIYPRQLQQSALLINHVIHTLKIAPENIIITGDSAGANLTLALLSHISHPHPSADVKIPKVELVNPVRGIAMIGPWVSFSTKWNSIQRNKYRDFTSAPAGKLWSGSYLGAPWPHTSKNDFYNEPITAPESWWNDLQVEDILIVAGGDEVLIDGIVEFSSKLKKGVDNSQVKSVTFEVAKGEYHVQPILDLAIKSRLKEEGVQAKTIKKWISDKF